MTDEPIELDQRRGLVAQEATSSRRLLSQPPALVLSEERRSAKWRGVGRFPMSNDTLSAQTKPKSGPQGANAENLL